MKKNVLITGGLGFVGSNLAHRLVNSGAKVTLIDSLIPEYGGNMFNIYLDLVFNTRNIKHVTTIFINR